MKIRDYMMVTGAVCALVAVPRVFAQADEDADEADPIVVEQLPDQDATKNEKGFDLLVRATSVRGTVEVNNPDLGTFAPIVNNKAYPLGSVFRTGANSSMTAVFSATESVQLFANTEVTVLAPEGSPAARCVQLAAGRVKTFLKDNLLEDQFSVETPNAACRNMAGRADISLSKDGENENFQAATITGGSRVVGPQYTIEALRAANTVNVLTTPERALSSLTSVKGDFKITLDNGTDEPVVYEMSPKAVVKIWRVAAPVGGRLVVTTLVVSPTGTARHRFSYAEGRAELVTGEQAEVVDEQKDKLLQDLLKEDEKKSEKKDKKRAAGQQDDARSDDEDEEQ